MAPLDSGPKFQGWVSKVYFTNSSLLASFATVYSDTRDDCEQQRGVKSVPTVVAPQERGQLLGHISEVTQVRRASWQPHNQALLKVWVPQLLTNSESWCG